MAKSSALLMCLVVVIGLVKVASSMPTEKTFEDELPADTHVQEMVSSVGADIQRTCPRLFQSIEPVSYRSHVVAGRNYLVKALIHRKNGNSSYVHLRIYKPVRGRSELIAMLQENIERDTPLEYFE